MKHLGSAVLVTVGLLAFGATTASAAVVCNGEGDCWRTKERYTYPPDAGVRVYSDDWKWGPNTWFAYFFFVRLSVFLFDESGICD